MPPPPPPSPSRSSNSSAAGDAAQSFTITEGIAMSNLGALSEGVAANEQPLNAATGGSPAREVTVTIQKGADAARLSQARDVLLWVEWE